MLGEFQVDPAAVYAHGHAVEDAEPPPAPVPVPMRQVDWTQYPQDPEDPVTEPDFCFWCEYAQSKQEYIGNKRVEKLVRCHNENNEHTNPFLFAKMMQDIYNRDLRPYLVRDGKRYVGPAWPALNIVEHTLGHTFSPLSIRKRIVMVYTEALLRMERKAVFLDDGTVSAKALDEYRKTAKELLPLLAKVEGARNTDLFSVL